MGTAKQPNVSLRNKPPPAANTELTLLAHAKKEGSNLMLLNVLKGKIHRAAGIQEYELVTISDCNNGNRLETYVIAGEPGSGVICLNGAAAHLVTVGDKVIIMNYCQMTPEEFADPEHAPHVVFVDDDNKISRLTRYEKHGKLEDLK